MWSIKLVCGFVVLLGCVFGVHGAACLEVKKSLDMAAPDSVGTFTYGMLIFITVVLSVLLALTVANSIIWCYVRRRHFRDAYYAFRAPTPPIIDPVLVEMAHVDVEDEPLREVGDGRN